MAFIKFVLAYDGTDFAGWQIQPNDRTIAGTIQNAYQRVFNEPLKLMGASRTDAGVHAYEQVAVAEVEKEIEVGRLQEALGAALPSSILLRSVEWLSSYTNPRYDVVEKTYLYHLFTQRPLPFFARYGWYYPLTKTVCWDKFIRCLALYQGTHDFGSFIKQDPNDPVQTRRTVNSLSVQHLKRYQAFRITIKGESFARYQIRRMVGTALDIARRTDLNESDLAAILKEPSDQQEFVKAEASGLCLRSIRYKEGKW